MTTEIDIKVAARYLEEQLNAGDALAALLRGEVRRIKRCFHFSEAHMSQAQPRVDLYASIGLTPGQVQAGSRSAMLYIRDRMTKKPDSIFVAEGDPVIPLPSAMSASGKWFATFPSKGAIWSPPEFEAGSAAYATYWYELSFRCSGEALEAVLRNARRYPLVAAYGSAPAAWVSSAGPALKEGACLEQISESASLIVTDGFDGEAELIFELS